MSGLTGCLTAAPRALCVYIRRRKHAAVAARALIGLTSPGALPQAGLARESCFGAAKKTVNICAKRQYYRTVPVREDSGASAEPLKFNRNVRKAAFTSKNLLATRCPLEMKAGSG